MSLSKRVLEGRFEGFGLWLGDMGEILRKQELSIDWVLLERGQFYDWVSQ